MIRLSKLDILDKNNKRKYISGNVLILLNKYD
jgi:hypothetical protein